MGKKKPEEISVGAYNKLMMDDAMQMLQNALVEVAELRRIAREIGIAAQNAQEDIWEAHEQFEQMRLDV